MQKYRNHTSLDKFRKLNYFNNIKDWYNYYKIYLIKLYNDLLKLSKSYGININNKKDKNKDFIETMYENSDKFKYQKYLEII